MQLLSWTIQQVMQDVIPGSVIILHDEHGHRTKVASIVGTMVPRLKASGYAFISIDEMERNHLNG